MKFLLLIIIVLVESIGLELGFIDEANFFNLEIFKKPRIVIENFDLNGVASSPVKVKSAVKPNISGSAFYSIDLASQTVLWQENANKKAPIASLTKIMTAVIATEEMDISDIVEVPELVNETTGSKIYILPGTKIAVRELMKGMLVRSANDCARSIEGAYDNLHKEGSFIKLMNKKARQLGMEKTKYVEASGLSEKNISTPRDLAILTSYALRKDIIRELVGTYQTEVVTASGFKFPITNTNRLLRESNDVYGVKTGYLVEAGQCFISAAKQNNHDIITVLFNAPDNNMRFWETRELINSSFSSYRW